MSGCTASVEIELDGELQDVRCSQPAGHPEDHSAKIWWASDAAMAAPTEPTAPARPSDG